MLLFALVQPRLGVIQLYMSAAEAASALVDALRDEPSWADDL
jgi:hypothetical protein